MQVFKKRILTLIIILAIFLLVSMVAVILRYDAESQARESRLQSISVQANMLERELRQLQRKAEKQEMQIYQSEGPGVAIIAFRISDEYDLQKALSYGAEYGFNPTILFNTGDDVDGLISLIDDTGLEIVLYSYGFPDDELSRILAINNTFQQTFNETSDSYLLRSNDDTPENQTALLHAGIRVLFLYGEELNNSVREDGTVTLNYSFINKSSYSPERRLSNLIDSEQALLFAIDMKETTVTEHQMDEIIELICQEEENGHIRIGSVADAVQTVQDRVKREKNRLNEYMAAQEERAARIAELEATIREIYSQWDK